MGSYSTAQLQQARSDRQRPSRQRPKPVNLDPFRTFGVANACQVQVKMLIALRPVVVAMH
jgi:hypothetical protein